MRRRVFQQGQADGLCGIYSILNFLKRTALWKPEAANETLWYIFEACRQLNLLTPAHLTEGFDEHEVKKVLDKIIFDHRMPYETFFLGDVVRSKDIESFGKLAQRVCGKRGAIIASHDSRNHWILVTREGRDVVTIDSADPVSEEAKPLNPRQRSLSIKWGIVVLSKTPEKIEIDV